MPDSSTTQWLLPLGVAVAATFVLQTRPESAGPVVELGRLLARVTVVAAIALLAWRLRRALRSSRRWTPRVQRLAVVGIGLLCVATVLLGLLGYGDALGTLLVVVGGTAIAAAVVTTE
ncbi:hypothetical protein [Salinigranum salinum]|uniref:hypothetical protein n=1 Tax=Salinigranum salinum TaxID=1364937 RepID=UPI0012606001|nr:hypothetical protein [Salinigranum salinum]